MRLPWLYPVAALLPLAACSTSAQAVVRDDAADRLKCHPREIVVSERQDISLGAYQATGCGEVAIFHCHEGAGGIVDCTADAPAMEEPALGTPPQAPQPPKASASSSPEVTGNSSSSSNSKYDPMNGSLK